MHHTTGHPREDRRRGMDAPSTNGTERAALEHFAARKAAKHASAVLSTMRDALIIVDERGAITDVNGGFCTMTGFGRHQMIGKRKYPFWSRIDSAANSAAIAELLRTTAFGATEVELVLVRKSGERFRVSASIAPLRGRSDERIGYVGTLREIDRQANDPAGPTSIEPDQAGLIAELAAAIEEPSVDAAFARIAEHAAHAVTGDAAVIVRIADGDATRVGRWTAGGGEDLADIIAPSSVSQVFAKDGLRTEGTPEGAFASVIGCPIRLGGHPWGAVYVARANVNGPLPADASAMVARFVATATLALIAIDARRPSDRRAPGDPLTGLDDRAAFDERLLSELGRARRYGRDLSLVVVEMDDAHQSAHDPGDAVRDRVLTATAGIMRRLIRAGDVVARIRTGGFAWLLPETDSRGAILAAERAQALIGKISMPAGNLVTVSCGIADAREADHDPGEIFRHAELALRQARAAGGNGIARFGSSRPQVSVSGYGADGRRQTLASLRLVARVVDTTGGQSARSSAGVADLSERTARRMGWTAADAQLLHEATLVRDIGMLGIPEQIRSKPHGLSAPERKQFQTHAELGAQLVSQVLTDQQVGWIHHHHERFDGAGYPAGISGSRIPEGARIIAAADAWIEMVSELKGRTCTTEIVEQFEAEAGWQLCPKVVAALLDIACDRVSLPTSASSPSTEPVTCVTGAGAGLR